MAIEASGQSIGGSGRPSNQDRYLVATLSKVLHVDSSNLDLSGFEETADLSGHLLAVADGVGGAARGEEASEMAAEILAGYLRHTMPWFLTLRPDLHRGCEQELKRALEACHGALSSRARREGRDDSSYTTTLTLAYVSFNRLHVAHVGDSRCYLLRDGRLTRTTVDQTLAQAMVSRGLMSEEEARRTGITHVLTSALGVEDGKVDVQVLRIPLTEGDRLLLSSDGVHGALDDETLARLLGSDASPEQCCTSLLRAAVDAGSRDDATAIVADFHEDHDAPSPGS